MFLKNGSYRYIPYYHIHVHLHLCFGLMGSSIFQQNRYCYFSFQYFLANMYKSTRRAVVVTSKLAVYMKNCGLSSFYRIGKRKSGKLSCMQSRLAIKRQTKIAADDIF